ncbi:pre-mRNA-splicing factor 38-like [Lycorma delicatula]|uniref:pre-mRNA-splicing factor 38-like n=1 Tax=Lycorma delicatula TaxID=130591 RepID=UPI003F51129B
MACPMKEREGKSAICLLDICIRKLVIDSKYWKEKCVDLPIKSIVHEAKKLKFIGGVYGNNIKPTPFLCLAVRTIQLQPEKYVIIEFLNSENKYVCALGAFCMRILGTSLDCYQYLEPLFKDGRGLKRRSRRGNVEYTHMDEFVDKLLRKERVFDIILPEIEKRHVLENRKKIQPKKFIVNSYNLMEEEQQIDLMFYDHLLEILYDKNRRRNKQLKHKRRKHHSNKVTSYRDDDDKDN